MTKKELPPLNLEEIIKNYDSKCVECHEPLREVMWKRGYCYNCREPLEIGKPQLKLIQGGKKETKLE
jgi:hypothetical protein